MRELILYPLPDLKFTACFKLTWFVKFENPDEGIEHIIYLLESSKYNLEIRNHECSISVTFAKRLTTWDALDIFNTILIHPFSVVLGD